MAQVIDGRDPENSNVVAHQYFTGESAAVAQASEMDDDGEDLNTRREMTTTVERFEFGFRRTACACAACVNNCRHLPGYLVPADVPRIALTLGYADVTEFARDHLLASLGALVMKDGERFRIPTLVPRRRLQIPEIRQV